MTKYPNELMRYILKIKYDSWVSFKRCVCGCEDFKSCPIVECFGCNSNYCVNTHGYNMWMWECRDCFEWFCGDHKFYLTPSYAKVCKGCCNGVYKLDERFALETVPLTQVQILKQPRNRFLAREYSPDLTSVFIEDQE